MKNLLSLLFLLLFVSTFFACGNTSPKSTEQPETSVVSDKPTVSPIEAKPNQVTLIADNAKNSIKPPVDKADQGKVADRPVPSPNQRPVNQSITPKVKKVTPSSPAPKETSTEVIQIKEATFVTPENPQGKVVISDKANQSPVIVEEPKMEEPKKEAPEPTKAAFNHQKWDQLLKKHVNSNGKVNYKGFKADQDQLQAYLSLLEATPLDDAWPREKKMAYWINAYNAYTVQLIVKNYPISSITKLDGGKPWDKKWIKLSGKTLSLNDIENNILRPQFKDPRIHFAVNCAAQSCPPLLNQAWTEQNLEANFEKQAKSFINNSRYNKIESNKASVSKIFDWYKADFGDLLQYLNKYATTPIKNGASIDFMEYDWSLNE